MPQSPDLTGLPPPAGPRFSDAWYDRAPACPLAQNRVPSKRKARASSVPPLAALKRVRQQQPTNTHSPNVGPAAPAAPVKDVDRLERDGEEEGTELGCEVCGLPWWVWVLAAGVLVVMGVTVAGSIGARGLRGDMGGREYWLS
ncbi:hypothetical protein EDC01DRAFT_777410 [Geopyxis carbonaria]|nr:hypothetical protein EDC01DRAFT_777410 [Geopyxis carbonaria]